MIVGLLVFLNRTIQIHLRTPLSVKVKGPRSEKKVYISLERGKSLKFQLFGGGWVGEGYNQKNCKWFCSVSMSLF